MSVLIIKNIGSEGPGTIGEYLANKGREHKVLEPGEIAGATSTSGYDTLVVLGGPMGVYEKDRYPHVESGMGLIRDAASRGLKILGVCLGAQMMAHALGGRVYKGHGEEAGWLDIELMDEGIFDPVFGALKSEGSRAVTVLQWHGDTFDLPPDAVRLASSMAYPNQAFRYGAGAYALQFHVEVTCDMVAAWFKGRPDAAAVTAATAGLYPAYRARAERFYERFFG